VRYNDSKAARARELGGLADKRDPDPVTEEQSGSMREILEARIRDPQTSARDLAGLINSLARASEEEERTFHPFAYLRSGTLLLEPGPARADGDRRYRLNAPRPARHRARLQPPVRPHSR
jgi:hypothetical protein